MITGANGQVGRGLAKALYQRYGMSNVILSDLCDPSVQVEGKYVKLDVTDKEKFSEVVKENKINHILHLAGILSALGEKNLDLAMKVNIDGMQNALNIAKESKSLIFLPSTIATFGPNLEKKPVPDDVIHDPTTFYGISKVYAEKLGTYYHRKFGVDFRCLRYPAIITPYEFQGNGTASYPTELIHAAINHKPYTIFLDPDLQLPMMYIDDCIRGTLELIEAGDKSLSRRVYNFQGLSMSAKDFIKELKKSIKKMEVNYEFCSLRNEIAKTWPVGMDDKNARKDWEWKPNISTTKKLVEALIKDVVEIIQRKEQK